MTRLEENTMALDEINKIVINKSDGAWTNEEKVTFHLSTIVVLLADISKSLAIIADKEE